MNAITEDEIKLIYKALWDFIKKHPGLQFEDFLSEAYIAYAESINQYDATKGKRSTYIYHVVHNQLTNLVSRKSKEIIVSDQNMETLNIEGPDPEDLFLQQEQWNDLYADLSPDAKIIYNLIHDDLSVFLPIDKPRQCRGIIAKTLQDKGWKPNMIWKAFNELKEAANHK